MNRRRMRSRVAASGSQRANRSNSSPSGAGQHPARLYGFPAA